jgi:hypothetical protein
VGLVFSVPVVWAPALETLALVSLRICGLMCGWVLDDELLGLVLALVWALVF